MKNQIETLVIYRKDGSVLKEIDVTNWSWKRKWQRIQICMGQLILSDHWDIIKQKRDDQK